MARLMDGYERALDTRDTLGPRLFVFGVVTALFHDVGYLRNVHDTRHRNGAEHAGARVAARASWSSTWRRWAWPIWLRMPPSSISPATRCR